jgi:hypothetical protein
MTGPWHSGNQTGEGPVLAPLTAHQGSLEGQPSFRVRTRTHARRARAQPAHPHEGEQRRREARRLLVARRLQPSGTEREREREMCRRCRRIYIRAAPRPQPFPSRWTLPKSREQQLPHRSDPVPLQEPYIRKAPAARARPTPDPMSSAPTGTPHRATYSLAGPRVNPPTVSPRLHRRLDRLPVGRERDLDVAARRI